MLTSPYSSGTTPGIDYERAPGDGLAALVIDRDKVPEDFPVHLWQEQAQRYRGEWDWFTGVRLAEERGKTEKGDPVYKYPLQINPIRQFSRKLASLIFGEVPDNPSELVKTSVRPRQPLIKRAGSAPSEAVKELAEFCEAAVGLVWNQSDASAILMENATLAQFLGGCYFQVDYVPQRKDLLIPIVVRNIKPDFVLPIWNPENYYDLSEVYIIYRVAAASVTAQFGEGVKMDGNPWAIYCEHWTRETYSITIDGKPLKATYVTPYGDVVVDYTQKRNPYRRVPVFYIPRLREGTFYGPSIVPDLEGLTREINGRLADMGDLLRKSAHEKWFGRNLTQNPKLKQFDNGSWYIDLGNETGAFKNPPEIWKEDPPVWSDTMSTFNDTLFSQLMSSGSLSPIMLGVDDSSQRSSLSLQLKMMPATQMARSQRLHWQDGLNHIARMILQMMIVNNIAVDGYQLKRGDELKVSIDQRWQSMVPRDREALVQDTALLKEAGLRSRRFAVENLGDVPNQDEELDAIEADLRMEAELQTEQEVAKIQAQASLRPQPTTPSH